MASERIYISNEMFGEWQQLHKELYPFETTIYSFTTCYRIILHMKLSLSMEGYLAETRIITDYLGKPIGAIGGGTIALI